MVNNNTLLLLQADHWAEAKRDGMAGFGHDENICALNGSNYSHPGTTKSVVLSCPYTPFLDIHTSGPVTGDSCITPT